MINVAELITDPDFAQPSGINLTRFVDSVVNHRVVQESVEMNIPGILILLRENSDERLENYDRNVDELTILTHERLKCVGEDKFNGSSYGSDIIHYRGADYIVKSCQDLAEYGYCRSKAIKIEQDVM